MAPGVANVSEQRIITTHVVVIDWLVQEGAWAAKKNFFRFGCSAEFVQAEAGMQKTGGALWSHTTEFPANYQSTAPAFALHQVMQP